MKAILTFLLLLSTYIATAQDTTRVAIGDSYVGTGDTIRVTEMGCCADVIPIVRHNGSKWTYYMRAATEPNGDSVYVPISTTSPFPRGKLICYSRPTLVHLDKASVVFTEKRCSCKITKAIIELPKKTKAD